MKIQIQIQRQIQIYTDTDKNTFDLTDLEMVIQSMSTLELVFKCFTAVRKFDKSNFVHKTNVSDKFLFNFQKKKKVLQNEHFKKEN